MKVILLIVLTFSSICCSSTELSISIERSLIKKNQTTRIPFKIQFTLNENPNVTSENVLYLLAGSAVPKVRLDIEGKMFPFELIYSYDEIEELTLYRNDYFFTRSKFYIVPFPSFLRTQFESDQYILTGYLVKYEEKN